MRPAGERWARVKELFEADVDLDPTNASPFSKRNVASQSLRDLFPDTIEDPFVDRQFGAYQLIREIGRGRLGAVLGF